MGGDYYGVPFVSKHHDCVKTACSLMPWKYTELYRSPDLLNRPHALLNQSPDLVNWAHALLNQAHALLNRDTDLLNFVMALVGHRLRRFKD